jgi:hypothetical protein
LKDVGSDDRSILNGVLCRYPAFGSIRVKRWHLIVLNSSLALAPAAEGMLAYHAGLYMKICATRRGCAHAERTDQYDAKPEQEALATLRSESQVAEAFARYDRAVHAVDFERAQVRPDGVYFAL